MNNHFPAKKRLPDLLPLGIFLLAMIVAGYARAESSLGAEIKPAVETKAGKALSADEQNKSDKKTDLVSRGFFGSAGFIVRSLDTAGSIMKSAKDRIVYALEDIVFLDIGSEKGAKAGDKYAIVTQQREVYHPVLEKKADAETGGSGYLDAIGDSIKKLFPARGKKLGYIVRQWGTLEIVETQEKYSKARIFEAFDRIEDGYRLIPYEERATPQLPADHSFPAKDIEGYIVAIKRENAVVIGEQDVVYIDKGEIDNVAPGDRFRVYDIKELTTESWHDALFSLITSTPPPEKIKDRYEIGEIMVISTQPETSTAVVVYSSKEVVAGLPVAYKLKGK